MRLITSCFIFCSLAASQLACTSDQTAKPTTKAEVLSTTADRNTDLSINAGEVKDKIEDIVVSTNEVGESSIVSSDDVESGSANSNTQSANSDKEQTKTKKKKPRKPKLKPIVKFDLIRYDFGTINQGDTVDYNYKFMNVGKAPLEILNVSVSCGCTQPSYPFIPIAPGEEGYIGIKYVSVNKEGDQKPTISVYSNASKAPITLLMTGHVNVPENIDETSNKLEEHSVQQDSIKKDSLK